MAINKEGNTYYLTEEDALKAFAVTGVIEIANITISWKVAKQIIKQAVKYLPAAEKYKALIGLAGFLATHSVLFKGESAVAMSFLEKYMEKHSL